jgi:hypothetical protein
MAQSAKLKNLYQKLAERLPMPRLRRVNKAQSAKLKNLYQKLAERLAHGVERKTKESIPKTRRAHGAWRRAQNYRILKLHTKNSHGAWRRAQN